MSSQRIVKFLIITLWFLIASTALAYAYLQPTLPINLLNYMASNPLRPYALFCLASVLCLLAVASVGIFRSQCFYKRVFTIVVLVLPIILLLLGVRAVPEWISFFDDFTIILLGIIVGLIYSDPTNQLVKPSRTINLATNINLKILSFLTLLTFILSFAVNVYSDPLLPTMFKDFLSSQPIQNIYLERIGMVSTLLFPFSLILLFFRLNIARYLFILTTFGMLMSDSMPADALSGLSSLSGYFLIILMGILSAIIWSKRLSQQFIFFKKKRNFLRTFILSFYSKSFYREVAFKWKGFGLFNLLILAGISAYFSSDHFIENNSAKRTLVSLSAVTDQMPNLYIYKNNLSIKEPVPYFFYDKDKNIVAIIDTSGKYNTLSANDKAKLLITKNTIFIKDSIDYKVKALPISLKQAYLTINKNEVQVMFGFIKFITLMVFFFLFLIIKFVIYLLLVLLIAWLGASGRKLKVLKLDYKARVRLIILAFTPVALINGLTQLIGWLPIFILYFPLIIAVYVIYSKFIVKTISTEVMQRANRQAPV
ncbi:MAG: DUF1189 family protein [Gammaproteobacteria bacterium]|nr:DUF1189 family protein [Gammaproteobacteria bacterium]